MLRVTGVIRKQCSQLKVFHYSRKVQCDTFAQIDVLAAFVYKFF